MTSLSSKNKFEVTVEEKITSDKIKTVFPDSLTPSILLLDDSSDAFEACDKILHREDHIPKTNRTIDSCKTLFEYLPENQKKNSQN